MEYLIAALAFAVGMVVGALAVVKSLAVAIAGVTPIIKALQEDTEELLEKIHDEF